LNPEANSTNSNQFQVEIHTLGVCTGFISFEISKNRYGNLKVNSAAVSKLMTFAVELRALQHQNGEQEEGNTVLEGA
jgi:Holliday junction resolvase